DGQSAQDVVRIATADGRYLRADDGTGAVGLVDDADAATPFAVYASVYTAAPYDGTGGAQQTTYAIRSLSSGRYLTIQNYAGDDGRPYYSRSGGDFVVTATAPEAQWNE